MKTKQRDFCVIKTPTLPTPDRSVYYCEQGSEGVVSSDTLSYSSNALALTNTFQDIMDGPVSSSASKMRDKPRQNIRSRTPSEPPGRYFGDGVGEIKKISKLKAAKQPHHSSNGATKKGSHSTSTQSGGQTSKLLREDVCPQNKKLSEQREGESTKRSTRKPSCRGEQNVNSTAASRPARATTTENGPASDRLPRSRSSCPTKARSRSSTRSCSSSLDNFLSSGSSVSASSAVTISCTLPTKPCSVGPSPPPRESFSDPGNIESVNDEASLHRTENNDAKARHSSRSCPQRGSSISRTRSSVTSRTSSSKSCDPPSTSSATRHGSGATRPQTKTPPTITDESLREKVDDPPSAVLQSRPCPRTGLPLPRAHSCRSPPLSRDESKSSTVSCTPPVCSALPKLGSENSCVPQEASLTTTAGDKTLISEEASLTTTSAEDKALISEEASLTTTSAEDKTLITEKKFTRNDRVAAAFRRPSLRPSRGRSLSRARSCSRLRVQHLHCSDGPHSSSPTQTAENCTTPAISPENETAITNKGEGLLTRTIETSDVEKPSTVVGTQLLRHSDHVVSCRRRARLRTSKIINLVDDSECNNPCPEIHDDQNLENQICENTSHDVPDSMLSSSSSTCSTSSTHDSSSGQNKEDEEDEQRPPPEQQPQPMHFHSVYLEQLSSNLNSSVHDHPTDLSRKILRDKSVADLRANSLDSCPSSGHPGVSQRPSMVRAASMRVVSSSSPQDPSRSSFLSRWEALSLDDEAETTPTTTNTNSSRNLFSSSSHNFNQHHHRSFGFSMRFARAKSSSDLFRDSAL